MKLLRPPLFNLAVVSVCLGPSSVWPQTQTAIAQGHCGVALNASGQAYVVVNNHCDAKTAAAVQKLVEKSREVDKKNERQDQRIQRLEADNEAQARQLAAVTAAVQSVQKQAASPTATPADKRAAELLAQGDASGAITLLGREAEAAKRSADKANQSAAQLYRLQAALLRTLDATQALGALERALAAEPDDFQTLWDAGDLAVVVGNLEKAEKLYTRMDTAARRALEADPENPKRQRDLSVSYDRIGNTQIALGDTAGALKSYQAGLALREKLAASDPRNTGWQRDLSVSYNKIGDTQIAQGDTAGALKSYQAGFAIADKLAASDPHNTEWQRDLSISYERIGDTQIAQGDTAGALKSYQADLAIADKLAASDPRNTGLKLDLAASYWKVASAKGVAPELRQRLLKRGLGVLENLQAIEKLPHHAKGWPKLFEQALHNQ